MNVPANAIHRTAKMFIDSGKAASIDDAEEILGQYILQIEVGRGLANHRTRQALALTAVNTGARAFLGGVHVRLSEDPILGWGWCAGRRLSVAVEGLGGTIVAELAEDAPTVCVGDCDSGVRGAPIVRATFDGWTAGVVEGAASPLAERDWFAPAGVTAAGIAVGEAFEARRGNVRASRRSNGLSLWRPGGDWLDADSVGPKVDKAPSRWWIIGLGHLGQAYLWTIGLMPYKDPGAVLFMLQDGDLIARENESTGLLTPSETWRGQRKARAVAGAVEGLGMRTTISERRFQSGHGPVGDEPRLALVGVDNPQTRTLLSDAGFELSIDAGLGGGPTHYLDILTHVFPSGRRSDDIPGWRDSGGASVAGLLTLPGYEQLRRDTGDECGVVEVAGQSVAAAFVGATAAGLVVGEATRYLLGGDRYSVIDASLRDLSGVQVVEAIDPDTAGNPGFAELE